MNRYRGTVAAAFVASLVGGCAGTPAAEPASPAREAVKTAGAETVEPARPTGEHRAPEAWQARWDPAELARAVEAWQRLAAEREGDPTPLLRVAAASDYGARAMLARGESAEAARDAFNACHQAAQEAASRGGGDEADYYAALCRARSAALMDHAEVVLVHAEVLAVMERCAGKPFDHGGPDRYLGAYYARPLAFEHRDLERAARHFERALSADPAHLPTHVDRARTLAVARQDREAFEADIRHVMEHALPEGERRGAAELARARAATLLKHAPDLFE